MIISVLFLLVGCRVRYKSSDLFKNKDSELFYKKAQDLQIKGQLDSALVYFDKANQIAPNTAVILHERGLIKSNMKKYKEAIVDLSKSIELTTEQRQKEIRISNRGLTYMQMNMMVEACKDWEDSGKWGKIYLEEYCCE